MIAAWIWTLIWYVLLDPLKWIIMWLLNEEGVRDWTSRHLGPKKNLQRRSRDTSKDAEKEFSGPPGMVPPSFGNPLGRASMSKPVSAVLDRNSASVVAIDRGSMQVGHKDKDSSSRKTHACTLTTRKTHACAHPQVSLP